jgi:S2P endopeptidase
MGEYCTNPVAILSQMRNRCDSSTSCLESQSCIKPRGDQDILRITVNHEDAGTEDERIVLWSGPRYEVWEQGMIHDFGHVVDVHYYQFKQRISHRVLELYH